MSDLQIKIEKVAQIGGAKSYDSIESDLHDLFLKESSIIKELFPSQSIEEWQIPKCIVQKIKTMRLHQTLCALEDKYLETAQKLIKSAEMGQIHTFKGELLRHAGAAHQILEQAKKALDIGLSAKSLRSENETRQSRKQTFRLKMLAIEQAQRLIDEAENIVDLAENKLARSEVSEAIMLCYDATQKILRASLVQNK
eukprot:768137-Hanusia_phi.AAC.11